MHSDIFNGYCIIGSLLSVYLYVHLKWSSSLLLYVFVYVWTNRNASTVLYEISLYVHVLLSVTPGEGFKIDVKQTVLV